MLNISNLGSKNVISTLYTALLSYSFPHGVPFIFRQLNCLLRVSRKFFRLLLQLIFFSFVKINKTRELIQKASSFWNILKVKKKIPSYKNICIQSAEDPLE